MFALAKGLPMANALVLWLSLKKIETSCFNFSVRARL